jgi:hypothetical protein
MIDEKKLLQYVPLGSLYLDYKRFFRKCSLKCMRDGLDLKKLQNLSEHAKYTPRKLPHILSVRQDSVGEYLVCARILYAYT